MGISVAEWFRQAKEKFDETGEIEFDVHIMNFYGEDDEYDYTRIDCGSDELEIIEAMPDILRAAINLLNKSVHDSIYVVALEEAIKQAGLGYLLD